MIRLKKTESISGIVKPMSSLINFGDSNPLLNKIMKQFVLILGSTGPYDLERNNLFWMIY
jgi:hypothetical protein